MRKLYNHNKGKIHPSPPPTTTADHLSLLPLAIATLAAALSPEEKEVLAYLLSCSVTTTTTTKNNNSNNFSGNGKPTSKINGGDGGGGGGGGGGGNHPPQFNCNCFTCYTSYWVRWDSSPNRQLIHEIIDAYEDGLISNKKSGKNKKERRKNKVASSPSPSSPHAPVDAAEKEPHAPPQVEESLIDSDDDGGDLDELVIGSSSSEKGSVRKLVSFIGERIWGVWGI